MFVVLKNTEEGAILKKAYEQLDKFSKLVTDDKQIDELKGLFENLQKLRKKEKDCMELDKSKIAWYQEFKRLLDKVRSKLLSMRQGHLPLHSASLYGNYEAVKVPLKEGKKWNFQVIQVTQIIRMLTVISQRCWSMLLQNCGEVLLDVVLQRNNGLRKVNTDEEVP